MTFLSHGSAAALTLSFFYKKKKRELPSTKLFLQFFFLGIIPDIPLFLLFLSGEFDPDIHHHHQWITHTPVFWIGIGLFLFLFRKNFALCLTGATLLHLSMDWYGGGDGIAFLYPLSEHQFGIGNTGLHGERWLSSYLSNPILILIELLCILPATIILSKIMRNKTAQ